MSKILYRSSTVVLRKSDAAFPKADAVRSAAILFSDDNGFMGTIVTVLRGHDWRVTITADPGVALAAATPDVAVVILDMATPGAVGFVERLRSSPQPVGGVPVLQYGGTRLLGVSALLPHDGAAAARDAVECFTGLLGDHAMRALPPTPFYRLIRLLGVSDAASMIARFAETLRATLAETALTREDKHRLAGLAGAIGYGDLSIAWRDAEHGGAEAEAIAIGATHATLAQIERYDLSRYRT